MADEKNPEPTLPEPKLVLPARDPDSIRNGTNSKYEELLNEIANLPEVKEALKENGISEDKFKENARQDSSKGLWSYGDEGYETPSQMKKSEFETIRAVACGFEPSRQWLDGLQKVIDTGKFHSILGPLDNPKINPKTAEEALDYFRNDPLIVLSEKLKDVTMGTDTCAISEAPKNSLTHLTSLDAAKNKGGLSQG